MANTVTNSVLEYVNTPQDLKCLSTEQMNVLAQEMRELIIKKVNATGGHMGPNLGFVEATIALHKVFNSPKDKIIFDVSHQCYPHKILTGRKTGFTNPDEYYTFTGYTAPEESEHDLYKVGHTSTSVSLAVGTAKARDLKGENGNVIAIIGDGSMSGGEAYEGLNNAAVLNSNIIIIVNDNEMSIAKNQGGLYKNLELLRNTKGQAQCNFFKSLGFDYRYIDNGHDIDELISLFNEVKDINHPIIIHLHTIKGKGLEAAEINKEAFHWVMPGILDKKNETQIAGTESYTSLTADFILNKAQNDKTVVAITSATPGVVGFSPEFRQKLGSQFVDVGITEEHGIAFASSLAKSGVKPIFAVLSSFIQRAYDQLSQDLCLNNSPATILVYWGSISDADATHLQVFDIPVMSNIPNLVYLAPTNKEEYLKMLDWSVEQTSYPVAIRVPSGDVISAETEDKTDYSVLNKYKVVESGNDVAIIALGSFFELGRSVKNYLKEITGIDAALINPCYITGLDKELLNSLKSNHKLVITLEDGILDGGFGEKIARFYADSDMKVLNFGAQKEFTDRVGLEELYQRYHLTKELIVKDIQNIL